MINGVCFVLQHQKTSVGGGDLTRVVKTACNHFNRGQFLTTPRNWHLPVTPANWNRLHPVKTPFPCPMAAPGTLKAVSFDGVSTRREKIGWEN